MRLKLLFANPGMKTIKREDGLHIYLSVHNETEMVSLIEKNPLDTAPRRRTMMRAIEEGCLVLLQMKENMPEEVFAYRSITSSSELYYGHDSEGCFLLSDSFRNAVVQLHPKDRVLSREGMLDHYLTQTTPGRQTHLSSFKRLGHGELLHIRTRDKSITFSQIDRLENLYGLASMSLEEGLNRIDQGLNQVIVPEGNTANLLSGGIDSTLIQTYLGGNSRSISGASDSPEYAGEMQYANEAARWNGNSHQFAVVKEADFLTELETATLVTGLPMNRLHAVLLCAVFRESPCEKHMIGLLADVLLGMGDIRTAKIARLIQPLRHLPFKMIGPAFFRRKRNSFEQLVRIMELDPLDYRGFAFAGFGLNTDVARKLIPQEALARRLGVRRDYVLERIDYSESKDKFWAHAVLGSLTDMLCDDSGSIYRQMAFSQHATLHEPFATKTVVRTSLDIPIRQRYMRGLEKKYLLKKLLKRRLSSYPVNRKKGGSRLPHYRYCRRGPLTDFFKAHQLPKIVDFIPDEKLLHPTPESVWLQISSITYTLWVEKVAKNDKLEMILGTINLQF